MRDIFRFGIYRHFKGGRYIVLGVSTPTYEHEQHLYRMKVTEVNSMEEFSIYANDKDENMGNFVHDAMIGEYQYVIYKSLYDDSPTYAREISDFLADKPYKYKDMFLPLHYRFTLSKGNVKPI